MSDEEIVCSFMEPKPSAYMATGSQSHPSIDGWWVSDYQPGGYYWKPRELTLVELHKVEARLTEEQKRHYAERLRRIVLASGHGGMWHATAPQKIAALASVLRETK